MQPINTPLGSNWRGVSNAPLNAGFLKKTRWYHTNDAAASQYYTLGSAVTLAGDWEIEFEMQSPIDLVSSGVHLTAHNGVDFASSCRMFINNSHFWIVGDGGSGEDRFALADVNAFSELSTINIAPVSGDLSVRINNVALNKVTDTYSGNLSISTIGRKWVYSTSVPNFSGTIAKLKIWTNGDRNTGTLAHSWSFNTNLSTPTVVDTVGGNNATAINMTSADAELFTKVGADWLGQEMWVNPSLNGWLDNGGGEFELNGDGSFQNLQIATVTPNTAYRVTFNVAELSAPLKIQSTSVASSFSELGYHSIDFIPDGATLKFARVSGVVNATLRDISVKRLIEVA